MCDLYRGTVQTFWRRIRSMLSEKGERENFFHFLEKRGGPRLRFTFASHRRVLFLGRSGNVRLRHARGHQTPPLRLTLHLTVRLLRDTGQWVPSVETSPTNESSRRRRISNSAAVPRCSDVSALARRWDDKMRSCGAEKGGCGCAVRDTRGDSTDDGSSARIWFAHAAACIYTVVFFLATAFVE